MWILIFYTPSNIINIPFYKNPLMMHLSMYETYSESKYCLGIKKMIQIIFKLIYFWKILQTLIYVST